MSRASIACLGVLALFPTACFDPLQPAPDASGSSGSSGSSTDATMGSPTSAADPSGDPSGNPSSDPSGDPSGEPTGDPSGDPTGDPSGNPTSDSSGHPTDTSTESGDPTGDPSSESSPTTDDASSSDGESSSDDAPACAGQCVPDVPAGWEGPVVINEGDDAPACPGAFPQLVHGDRHADLSPGAASCDCDCGNVVGASCGAAILQPTNAACTVNQGGADVLQPYTCAFINNGLGTYALSGPTLETGGASCQPQATESIATPSWGRDVRSCSAPVGDDCDDGGCLPTTPDDHLVCIWLAGEAACPAGPWTQQVITYGDFEDDRDCTACSCGTPTGSCGGNVELNNQGCGVIYIGDVAPNTCGPLDPATHALWTPQVNASCAPSGGTLTGDVEPTGAITYCCT